MNWNRITLTIKEPSGRDIVITPGNELPIYFCMAQLEQGTLASDWEAAPEDYDEQLAKVVDAASDILEEVHELSVGAVNLINNSEEVGLSAEDNPYWEAFSTMEPSSWYTLSMMSST